MLISPLPPFNGVVFNFPDSKSRRYRDATKVKSPTSHNHRGGALANAISLVSLILSCESQTVLQIAKSPKTATRLQVILPRFRLCDFPRSYSRRSLSRQGPRIQSRVWTSHFKSCASSGSDVSRFIPVRDGRKLEVKRAISSHSLGASRMARMATATACRFRH